MTARAHGRLVFWEGATLWVLGTRPGEGRFPRTDLHAHHAVQVTIALRGDFELDARGATVSGCAAGVAPDVEHTFEAEGVVAHLFVDPEGRPGRELLRTLFRDAPLVEIPASRLAALPARLLDVFEDPQRTDAALLDVGRALLAQLAPGQGERMLSHGVSGHNRCSM